MKLIHTADNHLDMPLSSLPPLLSAQRKKERLVSFSKIIDYTASSKADMLIISGDLIHTDHPGEEILAFLKSQFERLGDIPVFIALGNHDYSLSSHNFPGNVHIFPTYFEQLEFNGATITGASFKGKTADLMPTLPPPKNSPNILCLHGDIISASEYNPLNTDILTHSGYDYIALGHVHTHIHEHNYAYPGCHDSGGFDECGEKGFIEAIVEKNSLRIKFIPSSTAIYHVIDFDISPYSSTFELCDNLPEFNKNDIYQLNFTGSASFVIDTAYISAMLEGKARFVTFSDNTRIPTDIAQSRIAKTFVSLADDIYDEELKALVLRYGIASLKGDDFDI